MKHEVLTVLRIVGGVLAMSMRAAPAQSNEGETGVSIPAGKEVLGLLRKGHRRLVHVSGAMVWGAYAPGLAWRWTGERK